MKSNKQKIQDKMEIIFKELKFVLNKINDIEVNSLTKSILAAKTIVVVGAGRVGLASTAFAMRLAHLGLNAFMLGDSNVSAISKGDLLLVSSGSGETQTIYDLVCIAKIHGARVALVTGNPLSRMGLLADVIVNLKSPSKINNTNDFKSRQPMTTLNEQCLWLFFDAVVLELMEKMKIKDEDMKKRHSILE